MLASATLHAATAAPVPPGTAALPASPAAAASHGDVWFAIEVNGTQLSLPARFVRLADGRLLASAEDLRRLRIRLPGGAPIVIRGQDHFALDAIDDMTVRIDEAQQLLQLEARAQVFSTTVLEPPEPQAAEGSPSGLGGFFNYDWQYLAADAERSANGWMELGAFGRGGFGTTTFLAHVREGHARPVRLDTRWTADQPSRMRSLSIGDSINRPAIWSRAARFGGLQWGTSFAVRPEFVAFPLPTLVGEAALPSSVELYVDNALRYSGKTPHGPFEIPNVPLVTGQGEVKMVVRDVLGRETVIAQPFHVDAQLLKAGLHDYTYETGFLRERYAFESNRYDGFFGAATHRLGLSDRVTGELHGELMADRQNAGAAIARLLPGVGVVNGAVAASRGGDGSGGLLAGGFRRQGRRLSYGVQTRLATPAFTDLADAAGHGTPREETSAHLSFAPAPGGSAYLTFVRRRAHDRAGVKLLGTGYSRSLAPRLYASTFALAALNDARAYTIGISLSYALDGRTTVSAAGGRAGSETSVALQAQRSLPQGSGLGYRLATEAGAADRSDAAVLWQTESGSYAAEAARASGETAYRLGASGGVAVLGSHAYLSRRLDDSFALVRVGDYAGVPVLVNNQPVAHTDARGVALVTHLRPYQNNPISIDPEALPLDAELGSPRRQVWPWRRGGSVVDFSIRPSRGALLTLVLESGLPLPAGALVQVRGAAEQFPVARRGEVYVKGLAASSEIEASWKGQRCSLQIAVPADGGPLPVLGPFVCEGVQP